MLYFNVLNMTAKIMKKYSLYVTFMNFISIMKNCLLFFIFLFFILAPQLMRGEKRDFSERKKKKNYGKIYFDTSYKKVHEKQPRRHVTRFSTTSVRPV